MGNGTVEKGLAEVSVKFRKSRSFGFQEPSTYIIERLERSIGGQFVVGFGPKSSYAWFKQKVEDLWYRIPVEPGQTDIEVVFTLRKNATWTLALVDPYNNVLVRSRRQIAVDNQYAAEDAQAAIEKQQRLTAYGARRKEQDADDELKGVIRDGSGRVVLNIYEAQRRGSDEAAKLDASMNLYAKSGFLEKYRSAVVLDYFRVLNSQVSDLQEFHEFLMSKSESRLGRFVTWTGAIDRPQNLKGALAAYDSQLQRAVREFQSDHVAKKALASMALVEHYCGYASGVLKKFYDDSVAHSKRIAFAIQIAQMAIPIGASAKGLQMLCLVASEKFSYEITKKAVYGSDTSWSKTLFNAGVGTAYDAILRFGVGGLIGKIPVINGLQGIPGDIVKIAVNTLTSEIANGIGESFKGATFGEALSNLLDRLANYQTWVSASVAHTSNRYFGTHLDLPGSPAPVSVAPESDGLGDGKPDVQRTTAVSAERPRGAVPKGSAILLPIVLMFGFARSANAAAIELPSNKPVAGEVDRAPAPVDTAAARSSTALADSNRGVAEKAVPNATRKADAMASAVTAPSRISRESRGTTNATAGPEKPSKFYPAHENPASANAAKPPGGPATPFKAPVAVPIVAAIKPRRRRLRTIDDEDNEEELTAAYKRIGFHKVAHPKRYQHIPYGKYQTSKAGKDYEYSVKIRRSDGSEATVKPDDLVIAADGKRLDVVEYKHFKDADADAVITKMIEENGNILDEKIYKALQASLHYVRMEDKFSQMMNYVELAAKYPESVDRIVYRCSDDTTKLIYESFVKANLLGIYQNRPKMLRIVDKIVVIVDP